MKNNDNDNNDNHYNKNNYNDNNDDNDIHYGDNDHNSNEKLHHENIQIEDDLNYKHQNHIVHNSEWKPYEDPDTGVVFWYGVYMYMYY